MANSYTKIGDIINPEVMSALVSAKVDALCQMIKYAKTDNTLKGAPGDTVTVPKWGYIGDAEDYNFETMSDSDAEIETEKLTATSTTFTIKAIGKAVSIMQTAINSGLGDPVGQAVKQIATAMAQKMDTDVVTAAYTGSNKVTLAEPISYAGIVKSVCAFSDETDGIEKVMFIHPDQEEALLTDSNFLSADKFQAGVAVNGSIGKIAGCWIKKSKKVKKNAKVGTSGQADYIAADTYWINPIIKLEPDSPDTEYTEDEAPALTIFMKKDVQVDHEWFPKKQRHDITGVEYYGVALTNDAKVVLSWFPVAGA